MLFVVIYIYVVVFHNTTKDGFMDELEAHSEVHSLNTRQTDDRPKGANRMRYDAEVEVMKREIGSLDTIRARLGLSRRKLCQLLLVDPSAWSRWTREDEDAPPHIYRALQWYVRLHENFPAEQKPNYDRVVREVADLQDRLRRMQGEVQKVKQKYFVAGLAAVVFLAAIETVRVFI